MDKVKINVMFVTHADKKGGAEQSLIHLINYLDTSKYRIFLLSPGHAEYLDEIRTEYRHFPLSLHSIKKKFGMGYLQTIFRMKAFVKRNQIDIIHANGWRAPWYTAPLKFLTSCKLVWHHRDYTHLRMFNQVLPKFFDQVICISHFVANSIQGSNKTIIYNGVDPELSLTLKSRSFMEDDTLVIGTFGRIVEWKRYHLVIEAVKKLADNHKYNWKLLIVGDASVDGSQGYFNEMIQKVIDYGLEQNVIFYGYSKKPLEVMKECDLTINFSLNEPFGRVIIESMLVHTPVIVSDSGGAPEIIHQTRGGFIVKDGDVEELYQTIRLVYDKAVDHQELSNEGYRSVMSDFNMSTIARKVESTYHLLLAQKLKSEAAG
ncbi:glycosyltransferase involved in cell wall biosynthesis [Paenibacillus castaneae]|uniref:glycosyltransferase n=1 Tax=Paenibacillus castaneae TaxID=474957 RepID=UPI000C9B4012|nr:glycosyltransferase [Paenibacillus castaneae]NIK79537.1 glycosyltransferase involved in cell wall biosynthesis [Paenibacillus castaneae]